MHIGAGHVRRLGNSSQNEQNPDLTDSPLSNGSRIRTHETYNVERTYKTRRGPEKRTKLSRPSPKGDAHKSGLHTCTFMQTATTLHEGMPAPDFTAPTTNGKIIHLSDYRGKKVVLYFYPKDDTPGCTVEACGLRDHYQKIRELRAEVFGVSVDNTESHQAFTKKYNLPFLLVSDTDKKIATDYGVLNEKWKQARRVTFLIDEQGKVQKIFETVKPDRHPQEILDALRS